MENLKFAIEPLAYCKNELLGLLPIHDELLNTSGAKMNPDWVMYDSAASCGTFYVVTARVIDTDQIVGYFWAFLTYHPHHSDMLCAFTDTYFLHPEYRKGRNGMNLIKAAKSLLKDRGARVLYIGVRIDAENDKSKVFEYLGFEPIEMSYRVLL